MTLQLPTSQTFLTSLVSLSPERARHIPSGIVTQRLNYKTGRTLTESAMHREQLWIEEQLGIAGRKLSAGIVNGLNLAVADQAAEPGSFQLGKGRGITRNGQDVSILKPAQISVADLRELGVTESSEAAPRGLIAVVLSPTSVEMERLPDSSATRLRAFEDPCPPDRDTLPYLDFVIRDAAQLAFVQLDDALAGDSPARAPNRVAHALRQIETDTPEAAGWTFATVPLCVMFVAAGGTITWAHRAAVARQGGLLPQPWRTPHKMLRQSRLEGLVEETAAATSNDAWDGTGIADFIQHMPPSGILPRKCWDQPGCFPPSWAIAQAPIPISQLDAALAAASHLVAYDLDIDGERLKLLIPVPDHLYAADLLEPFSLPDFGPVLNQLRSAVGNTLALRNAYRGQALIVQAALDFNLVSDFDNADEDPIAGETSFPADAPDPTHHDTEARQLLIELHDGLNPTLFTDDQRALINPFRPGGPLIPGSDIFGVQPFLATMRTAIDAANDTVDFSFNRVQAEIYRLRQIMLDNEEATKLATFPALAGLVKGSNAFALSEGLKQHFLATKAVAAPLRRLAPPPPGAPVDFQIMALAHTTALSLPLFEPSDASPLLNTMSFEAPISVTATTHVADVGFGTGIPFNLHNSTVLSGFGDSAPSLSFGANFLDIASVSGKATTLVKDLVDNTRAELVDDAILADSMSKRTGILQSSPLPGDIRDVRSATVADRLKSSASVDAKASAVRIKADVLRAIQGLDISLDGLKAPLTSSRDRVLLPRAEIDAVIAATLTAAEADTLDATLKNLRRPVAGISEDWDLMAIPEAHALTDGISGVTPLSRLGTALLSRKAPITMELLPALALSKQLDPDPGIGVGDDDRTDDESAYLGSAIATLEGAIAFLRLVESRVLAISNAIETVSDKSKLLRVIQKRWSTMLILADQDLDEARHDLRVAQSLVAEETARLEARQAEKDIILAEAVKFIAYTRPRVLMHHREGTRLGLSLPGEIADPLPAALRKDLGLPLELEEMMGAMREMPIGWFTANPEIARFFRRPSYLDHLLGGVRIRANAALSKWAVPELVQKSGASAAQIQITKVAQAYSALTYSVIQSRQVFDAPTLIARPWGEKKKIALTLLSLNDLISAGKEPQVIKRANAELEQIERVLGAFWQYARQIPTPIRLMWAQNLSEFDTVTSLQSLARLPGWDAINFTLRANLDRLNTWLFSRMEVTPTQARALMTDIVRVALLLAAHAPVADIISARLEEEKTVRPGHFITIQIKRGSPQIGAQVAFLEANFVQARGAVRDLSGSRAQVEILHTTTPFVHLTQTQNVTIYQAQSLSLQAL